MKSASRPSLWRSGFNRGRMPGPRYQNLALQAHAADDVVVCGYASEFCVDTTTRRAAALGFSITLTSDAHTTHDKPHSGAAALRDHENATLPDLTGSGPRIMALPTALVRFAT